MTFPNGEGTGRQGGLAGSGPPAAIDRSVLGEWLDGDDAAINAMLAIFGESVRAEYARMAELLRMGDLPEYAKSAHRMRGAALAMGAHALAEIAGGLDAAAQEGDGARCLEGMTGLCLQLRRTMAEVPAAGDPKD